MGMEYLELLRSEFTTLLSTVWFEVFGGVLLESKLARRRFKFESYWATINPKLTQIQKTQVLHQS